MDWRPPSVQAAAMGLLLCLLLLPTAHAWSLPAPAPAPASARVSSVSVPIRAAAAAAPVARRLNEVSPYLDLALCPLRSEPWTCARQQSARILDSWDGELHAQWQKLKVEADRQMNATIERRGYSFSELPLKEKPSTILKKIEIGTNYMKKYLAESMDGFLGREYEYLQTSKATPDESENDQSGEDDDEDDEADAETTADSSDTAEEADQEEEDAEDAEDTEKDDDGDADDEEDADDDDNDDDDNASDNNTAEREPEGGEEEAEDDEAEPESENTPVASVFSAQPQAELQGDDVKNTVFSEDSASTGAEFIELVDGEETAAGAVKRPGGGGKRKKDKKKNKKRRKKGQKGQHGHGQDQGHTQPATLVVVQQAPEHHEEDSGHGHGSHSVSHGHGHGHGGGGGSVEHDDASGGAVSRPNKRKHKKRVKGRRKRKGQHSSGGAAVEHEQSDLSLGLGLLDDLTEANDELLGGGGKRKHRNPIRYGRSNGVTRGKKKKKKKALAKVMLVGTFLKAKIELLLKILGAHLQVKFFAIALIGLLINIARFWIDVKRGSPPSKVVYVEHAHHQHHYEDHGDDWSEPGSYWKRSLQTDPSVEDVDSSTDSYQIRGQHQHQPQPQQQQPQDSHYLAYRNQHQWQ